MADTIFTAQTPASTDFDGANHGWGMEFTVSDDCNCTGGRAYVPNAGRPGTFFWQLWRISDTTKIAETNLNAGGHGSPSSNTWMSFSSSLFTSPGDVALEAAEDYIVNVYFIGDGLFTDPGSFPVGSGGLVSSSTGRFNNGSGQNAMPASTSATYFFADVNAEAAGGTEFEQSVSGTVTAAGTLAKSTSRTLAASSTASGVLAKQTSRALSGSTTAAGAIVREVGKAFGGSITATGAIVSRAITRTLTATVTATGAIAKAISRAFGGSVTPSGSVSDAPGQQDIATTFRVGRPHGRWHAGRPHGRWRVGRPKGE